MKKKLTTVEAEVAARVIAEVVDAMQWDNDLSQDTDGGRITLALDPEKLIYLASAAIKLIRQ